MGSAWASFKESKLSCYLMLHPERECDDEVCFNLILSDVCVFKRTTVVMMNWIALGIVGMIALMSIMTVIYPLSEYAIQFFEWASWLASYLESGIFYLFTLWREGYGILYNFIDYLRDLTGGNSFIFKALFGLLAVFSLEFVALGFWKAAQNYIASPVYHVYYFLNTPLRYVKENWIYPLFGRFFGTILSLFLMFPIEMTLVILSLPIAAVMYVFQLIRDRDV